MHDDHPTFEIAAIRGNASYCKLVLRKKNGTWEYDCRPGELPQETRDILEQRQSLNWETLGFAVMDRLGEKGMKLREILL